MDTLSDLKNSLQNMILEKLKQSLDKKWDFVGEVRYINIKDISFKLCYKDANTDESYEISGICNINDCLMLINARFVFSICDTTTNDFIDFSYVVEGKKELLEIESTLNLLLKNCKSYKYFKSDYLRYTRQDPFDYVSELISADQIKLTKEIIEDMDDGSGCKYRYIGEYGEDSIEIIINDIDYGNMMDENDELYDFMDDVIQINVGDRFILNHSECSSYKIRNLILTSEIHSIPINDFLVRTSNAKCLNKEHHLKRIKALICIDNGISIKEKAIEALFCPKCNQYFISEVIFIELCKEGRLCCKVITLEEYHEIKQVGYHLWAKQSLLRSYGYTVNSNDNLSDYQRHRILSFMIENGLIGVDRAIDFIQWLIKQHSQKNLYIARQKWREDINYLLNYKPIEGIVRVRNIFKK